MAALLLLAGLRPGAEEVVPFAVGDWRPYVASDLPGNGIAAELVRKVCAVAGFVPKFVFYPWIRAERLVREGTAFASFPYQRVPDREDAFLYSSVIFTSSSVVVRASGDAKTAGFEYRGDPAEFGPFVVGTTAGTLAVIGPLARAGVQVVANPVVDQSLLMLERLHVDFVIDDRAVLEDAVRRLFPGRADLFTFLDKDFSEPRGYRLLVSKKYPGAQELLRRFDAALMKVQSEEVRRP